MPSVEAKDKFLGIKYGTACHRLRKSLLFDFAVKLGYDKCFRCGEALSEKDFTMDHKENWLHESVDLFWDLDNISFSHLSCNSANGSRPGKKIGPEGTSWCKGCKKFLLLVEFCKSNSKYGRNINGEWIRPTCKGCDNSRLG